MDKSEVKSTVNRIFSEYLTATGHRKTPERFAILDAIYSIEGHFNIDKLYEKMDEQEKFRVSRATLYNTVQLLLESQLLTKHQFGNTSQYEKLYNAGTHLHLICTQCGDVTEFEDEELHTAITNTKFRRFTLSHYSLYVYGLCSKCKRLMTRKENTINKKKIAK